MCKKVCSKCHRERTLREFHKSQATKSGYTSWCRDCVSEAREEREATLKELEVSSLILALY